jgi:two-component system OmpR family response regulator
MNKGVIFSIDDDQDLQVVVKEYLESDGYNVVSAYNIQQAHDNIESARPDVILLDLVLPDGEGLTLLPQLKTMTQAGIIVVSGKSDTTEKIISLEMGADDYITKPFEMRELSARIKAVLRRVNDGTQTKGSAPAKEDTVAFSKWVLNRAQYQAFEQDGQSLDLTTGEFKLLEALVSAPNRALSRDLLFDLTRDGNFDAYDRSIDIQIARIRKKLQDEDNNIIKTVRGVGYMYCDYKA